MRSRGDEKARSVSVEAQAVGNGKRVKVKKAAMEMRQEVSRVRKKGCIDEEGNNIL